MTDKQCNCMSQYSSNGIDPNSNLLHMSERCAVPLWTHIVQTSHCENCFLKKSVKNDPSTTHSGTRGSGSEPSEHSAVHDIREQIQRQKINTYHRGHHNLKGLSLSHSLILSLSFSLSPLNSPGSSDFGLEKNANLGVYIDHTRCVLDYHCVKKYRILQHSL